MDLLVLKFYSIYRQKGNTNRVVNDVFWSILSGIKHEIATEKTITSIALWFFHDTRLAAQWSCWIIPFHRETHLLLFLVNLSLLCSIHKHPVDEKNSIVHGMTRFGVLYCVEIRRDKSYVPLSFTGRILGYTNVLDRHLCSRILPKHPAGVCLRGAASGILLCQIRWDREPSPVPPLRNGSVGIWMHILVDNSSCSPWSAWNI